MTSNASVVIADDDAHHRHLTAQELRAAGYTVLEASDAAGAIHALSPTVDVVILDLKSAQDDARALCLGIKKSPGTGHVMVVYVSTTAEPDCTADASLLRPAEPSVLLATVRALLRVHHAERKVLETERRAAASEVRYRLLAELMPQLVWIADDQGTNTYMNARALEYFGRTSVQGQRIHPDDRERVFALWRAALDTKEPFETEARLMRHDGTFRWFIMRGVFVSPPGEPPQWLGTSTDIHDKKRVEEDLHQAAEFREELIAVVGHDLRNPLSAIHMGAKRLLSHGRLAPDDQLDVSRILSSSAQMARIIDLLLDFTRARLGGGIEIRREVVTLSSLFEQVRGELELAHPGRKFVVEKDGPLAGEWDGARIMQVMSNVLGNAIQHGKPDAPIAVALRGRAATATTPGEVEFTVTNEGAPISPDLLPHVFEAFRRTRVRTHRGLGLGLYITERLVKAHGGTVTVRSDASGTSFTVRLPMRRPR